MKFLKILFLTSMMALFNTIVYSLFNDITHRLYPPNPFLPKLTSLYEEKTLYKGKVSIMPINGDSREKLVFTYDNNPYSRVPPKVSIFHLDCNNTVIKRFKGKEGVFHISTNKDRMHPLAIFNYVSDIGYATSRESTLLSWSDEKLAKIPDAPQSWDIDKFTFCDSPFCRLIYFTGLGTINEIAFQLNQENKVDNIVLKEKLKIVPLSKRLKRVRFIACDDQLILIVYEKNRHPDKKHKYKYKRPVLLEINSSNQFNNVSHEYSGLKKLKWLQSAHLMSSPNQLWIYGVTLDNKAAFFLLDGETKTIVEITHNCGLEYLENIQSINFSNNLPSSQLVCILYKNAPAKLFLFEEGVFTDITDTCGIDNAFLNNVTSVNLIQDNFGTTMSINYFERYGPFYAQEYFRIFHDPEVSSF